MNQELKLNLWLPKQPELDEWRRIIDMCEKGGLRFHHLQDLADGGISTENLIRELGCGIPAFGHLVEWNPRSRRYATYSLALGMERDSTMDSPRDAKSGVSLYISFPNSVSTAESETCVYLGPAWRTALLKMLDPIVRVLDPPIGCSSPLFSDAEGDDDLYSELGWLKPGSRRQDIPYMTELTYLGKRAADQFGRSQLESLNQSAAIPMPLGGVLIDLLSSPPPPGDEDSKDPQVLLARHLNLPKCVSV